MDFNDFWNVWPRKVAKKPAQAAWNKLTDIQQTQAMQAAPLHVRAWRLEGRDHHKIPHASTWIHQERWTDELEEPKPPKPVKTIGWYETEGGILAKAQEMGIRPRPGEPWSSLKHRVREAINMAEAA